MKREEAVKLIKEVAEHQITLDRAEKILDALEEAGMTPPPIYLKYWNRYDNCWE